MSTWGIAILTGRGCESIRPTTQNGPNALANVLLSVKKPKVTIFLLPVHPSVFISKIDDKLSSFSHDKHCPLCVFFEFMLKFIPLGMTTGDNWRETKQHTHSQKVSKRYDNRR